MIYLTNSLISPSKHYVLHTVFPDTSRRVQLQGTGNRASRAHNATTRTTWVENHRDRFSFPRATFCPLGATPVDRRFFEIGVFPAPRARATGGTCTGLIGHFCFCVLLACVLHILRQPGSNTQYKFVRIRSCAWVPSYRVRVDHVSYVQWESAISIIPTLKLVDA